ncbi:MAG: hypothetical protein ABL907_19415 [Hyphomicrobium sp.]
MKIFAAIAAMLVVAAALAACSKTYIYRYKVVLEVETPEGIKSGYNVVELSEYTVKFPHAGVRGSTIGESLYLDLGSGRSPLVTLLTRRKGSAIQPFAPDLNKLYGGKYEWFGDRNPGLEAMIRYRGARELSIADLPELVTFSDPKDPKTVAAVDPNNLEASFGPGVKWHRMTIEITDERVTTGLEDKLPWLETIGANYLSGRRTSRGETLAHKLQIWDFSSRS